MNPIGSIFASEEVKEEVGNLMNNIKEELQAPFVPNFFKVWSDVLEALKGIYPAMKHILFTGHLSRGLKERLFLLFLQKTTVIIVLQPVRHLQV